MSDYSTRSHWSEGTTDTDSGASGAAADKKGKEKRRILQRAVGKVKMLRQRRKEKKEEEAQAKEKKSNDKGAKESKKSSKSSKKAEKQKEPESSSRHPEGQRDEEDVVDESPTRDSGYNSGLTGKFDTSRPPPPLAKLDKPLPAKPTKSTKEKLNFFASNKKKKQEKQKEEFKKKIQVSANTLRRIF